MEKVQVLLNVIINMCKAIFDRVISESQYLVSKWCDEPNDHFGWRTWAK